MKALQIIKPRQISVLNDVPIPNPSTGEVLIKNQYVGLCGSDMGVYRGEGVWEKYDYPAPIGWMGHENVGTIVESNCENWTPGTVVLAMPEDYRGYAEYFIAKPQAMVRLPLGKFEIHYFIMAQPLATILRAISKIESTINKNCAIVGQGPIGLIFSNLLHIMGAKRVIAIDPLDYRLRLAKKLGATHVTSSMNEDLTGWIRVATGGEMIDLCVEAVGTSDALSTAAHIVRRGGRLLIFGVPILQAQDFPIQHVFRNEINITSSVGPECASFFKLAVDLLSDGRLDLTPIIGPVLPWEKAEQAFHMYETRAKNCLKVVLKV